MTSTKRTPPSSALDALKDVDAILCTGDLADGKGDLARCCALLTEREVVVISGNHDRWLLGDSMRQRDGGTSKGESASSSPSRSSF